MDIYNLTCPDLVSLPTVHIKLVHYANHPITCVLGVLANEAGLQIQQEMFKWIYKFYNIISVTQDAPGTLYEYPAIRFAQWYSIQNNMPILYLHTKGAFNQTPIQNTIRNMWQFEFSVYHDWYVENAMTLNDFVGCPFTDGQSTWFNGWVANTSAFSHINKIPISTDRYTYETGLWNTGMQVQVTGRLLNNAEFTNLAPMWDIVNIFKT